MSSISTIKTLGALGGAFTSNRGGGVASLASNTVLCGYCGSGSGSTVRSVGSTTRGGAESCARAFAVSEASISGPANDIAATPIRHEQVAFRFVVLPLRLNRADLLPIVTSLLFVPCANDILTGCTSRAKSISAVLTLLLAKLIAVIPEGDSPVALFLIAPPKPNGCPILRSLIAKGG